MMRYVALPLLFLAACGPFFRRSDTPDTDALRLCVRNGTVAYGNIVARAGLVRFDVMPGREVCRRLSTAGPVVQLRAQTTGGGSAGPITYEATLQTGNARCWRWSLSESPASAADLVPCDFSPE